MGEGEMAKCPICKMTKSRHCFCLRFLRFVADWLWVGVFVDQQRQKRRGVSEGAKRAKEGRREERSGKERRERREAEEKRGQRRGEGSEGRQRGAGRRGRGQVGESGNAGRKRGA
jgi:hypothetical protein